MVYADTDFFVALLKSSDWLKSAAAAALEQYAGDIWTSQATLIELLLLADELDIDPERLLVAALELAELRGTEPAPFLSAAGYIKHQNTGVFDALHAAFCTPSEPILSSDHIFDRLGFSRVRLEPWGEAA